MKVTHIYNNLIYNLTEHTFFSVLLVLIFMGIYAYFVWEIFKTKHLLKQINTEEMISKGVELELIEISNSEGICENCKKYFAYLLRKSEKDSKIKAF